MDDLTVASFRVATKGKHYIRVEGTFKLNGTDCEGTFSGRPVRAVSGDVLTINRKQFEALNEGVLAGKLAKLAKSAS